MFGLTKNRPQSFITFEETMCMPSSGFPNCLAPLLNSSIKTIRTAASHFIEHSLNIDYNSKITFGRNFFSFSEKRTENRESSLSELFVYFADC